MNQEITVLRSTLPQGSARHEHRFARLRRFPAGGLPMLVASAIVGSALCGQSTAGSEPECPACRESVVHQPLFEGDFNVPTDVRPHQGALPVVIAVIEPSIDHSMPLISSHLWRNEREHWNPDEQDDDGNGLVDDVIGWDFSRSRGDPYDPGANDGHGTSVASVIAAAAERSSLHIKLMLLAARDPDGFAEAIRYAVDHGARVVVSTQALKCISGCRALRTAIEAAGRKNILFVFAAGNDGVDMRAQQSRWYPGILGLEMPNVMTVRAAGDCNSNHAGGISLLAAPTGLSFPCRNASPHQFEGTSGAAAFAAAAAAIVMQCRPEAGASPKALIRWLRANSKPETVTCDRNGEITFDVIRLYNLRCPTRY